VQILNNEGFPINSYGWMGVSIGNYAIVIPDYMGYCSFENVQLPFDLRVFYAGTYSYTYKNISVRNLHISTFYNPNFEANGCVVWIKFPQIEYGKYGYVRFISKDLFEQDYGSYFLISNNHESIKLSLQIPLDKTSITGKIIFIQCQSISQFPYNIYSYDNFGYKDITFHTGLNDSILFSPEDISFNPGESSVSLNITYPETYPLHPALIFTLSFPGYNKYSDIIIGKYYSGTNQVTQIVPASLNIPYTIKAECVSRINVSSYSLPYPSKVIEVHPDEFNALLLKKINLLSPQNHEEEISSNSLLKAEETGEKGIYVFSIAKDSINHTKVNIITDNSSIILKDITSSYFAFSPNTVYAWRVGKLSSFNSINQFVSEPYVFQENFNSIEFSDVWYFKTAP
jgi:hypothetical protein